MIIKDISTRIEGRIICCEERNSTNAGYAFSSGLMSNVLINSEQLVHQSDYQKYYITKK